MKAHLVTETKVYVDCPSCNRRAGRIDHLFDRLTNNQSVSFGDWYCDNCGCAYSGVLHTENTVELKISEGKQRTGTYDLLVIKPRSHPLYIVVKSNLYDWDRTGEGKAYWYDEHTCPTNWTRDIKALICREDPDPHGVAEFVTFVNANDVPLAHGCGDELDFVGAFPEVRNDEQAESHHS